MIYSNLVDGFTHSVSCCQFVSSHYFVTVSASLTDTGSLAVGALLLCSDPCLQGWSVSVVNIVTVSCRFVGYTDVVEL